MQVGRAGEAEVKKEEGRGWSKGEKGEGKERQKRVSRREREGQRGTRGEETVIIKEGRRGTSDKREKEMVRRI